MNGIPKTISRASRDMGADVLPAVSATLSAELSRLANFAIGATSSSSAAAVAQQQQDRLSCVWLIEHLSTVEYYDDTANKLGQFWGVLRGIVSAAYGDGTVLREATRVMGALARSGGAQMADNIQNDIRLALDWLRLSGVSAVAPGAAPGGSSGSLSSSGIGLSSSGIGSSLSGSGIGGGGGGGSASSFADRKLAAVMVLKELAQNAPVVFYVVMPQFMETIWVGLTDESDDVRNVSAVALECCMTICEQRQSSAKEQWYQSLFDRAEREVRSNVAELVHGALRVYEMLLRHSREFTYRRLSAVAKNVLMHKDNKEQAVRILVFRLIPLIARFDPKTFASMYLNSTMTYLLGVIKNNASGALIPQPSSISACVVARNGSFFVTQSGTILGSQQQQQQQQQKQQQQQDQQQQQQQKAQRAGAGGGSGGNNGSNKGEGSGAGKDGESQDEDFADCSTYSAVCTATTERGAAFIALGEVAEAVGVACEPYLEGIIAAIKTNIVPRGKQQTVCHETLTCIGSLTHAVPDLLKENHIQSLISMMFATGLSQQLVDAFVVMCRAMPTIVPPLTQPRLFDLITHVLEGLGPTGARHAARSSGSLGSAMSTGSSGTSSSGAGMGGSAVAGGGGSDRSGIISSADRSSGISLSSSSIIIDGSSRSGARDKSKGSGGSGGGGSSGGAGAGAGGGQTDMQLCLLALRALAHYDFGLITTAVDFARDTLLHFLEDSNVVVRRETALSCAALAAARCRDETGGAKSLIIAEIVHKLVIVGITDCEPSLRKTIFGVLDERFDFFLAQPEILRSLLTSLNDEKAGIRRLALSVAGRLAQRNPTYVMPALRKTLVQLLNELEFGDSRTKEVSAALLAHLIHCANNLVAPYVDAVLRTLLSKLRDSTSGPRLTSSLLSALRRRFSVR